MPHSSLFNCAGGGPQFGGIVKGAAGAETRAPELVRDRLGRQVAADRALKPGQKRPGCLPVGPVAGRDLKIAVPEKAGEEFEAVGGETDVAFAGGVLTLGKVSRQPSFGVSALAPQLELEDGPAQQSASVHFRRMFLEVDLPVRRA